MKLVTVKELSAELKVGVKTLYQWANFGQIPHVKLNGALRFDIDDISAWVERSKKGAEPGYNLLTQARGPRKGA